MTPKPVMSLRAIVSGLLIVGAFYAVVVVLAVIVIAATRH